MKIKPILSMALVAFSFTMATASEPCFLFKKKPAKTVAKPDSARVSGPATYQKFVKKSEKKSGLFTIYKSDNKVYLEIPAKLLGKEMMLSSKISQTSSVKVAVAGEMMSSPRTIIFTRSNDMLLLRDRSNEIDVIPGQEDVLKSILRNNVDPTIEAFKIVEKSAKDSSFVIDVTSFILSSNGDMGVRSTLSAGLLGSPKLSPVSSASEIIDFKAFEKNVNFKCRMVFKVSDSPYEAVLTRSIIMLPEKPMKARISDPKMSYFKTRRFAYDANKHKSTVYDVINRWDLQPKPEDVEAFKAGQLVEPAKPIVWYVDDAFPEKLKPFVYKAIEDWRPVFEKIGFKDAIIAKPFPKDDPNFDPEDIRYSCIRYITTPVMNAVGPSWVDPRSGEIIQGGVYIYHDAIRLIHNWMFSQMAAACPDVRKLVFSDSIIGRSMRYIVAHEVGHTLGLMHNFKSSSCFPVDSLRSASFTQKYGTTPSIMDYARFNYVAQPEDKGVAFTPPLMGEYDIFAIKTGYKPIFEADEKPIIKKWFDEVKGNKIYEYGQQSDATIDPNSQSEDLGDNPVKAGTYGIKNAKYILKNLKKWALENNYDLNDLADRYSAVVGQYQYYIKHATTLIKGVDMKVADLDDNQNAVNPIPFAQHKAALQFVLAETKDLPNWVEVPEITAKIPGLARTDFTDIQANNIMSILNAIPVGMSLNAKIDPTYSGAVLMDDMYNFIWKETIAGKNLDINTRSIQYVYVKQLMSTLGLTAARGGSVVSNDYVTQNTLEPTLNCSEEQVSSIPGYTEKFIDVEYRNLCLAQLLKIKDLLAARKNTGDAYTRGQYNFLLLEITKALQP